jgi:hypothetical protein
MAAREVIAVGARTGQLCGAQKRQSAGVCTRPAGWGTPHPGFGRCKLHGGSTRNQQASAAQEETRYLLGQLVGAQSTVEDPFKELRRVGGLALAWLGACEETIAHLKSFRYEDIRGGEQLRSEVATFERAMDRAALLLGTIAKLNLDEREVAVSEAKAAMLLRALDAGLAENGISGPQAAAIKQATGRHLKVVKTA